MRIAGALVADMVALPEMPEDLAPAARTAGLVGEEHQQPHLRRGEVRRPAVHLAPELFEVREDELLYVLNDNPPESQRANLEDAVNACPKRAISIDECAASDIQV